MRLPKRKISPRITMPVDQAKRSRFRRKRRRLTGPTLKILNPNIKSEIREIVRKTKMDFKIEVRICAKRYS